jgi:hypothetical protein
MWVSSLVYPSLVVVYLGILLLLVVVAVDAASGQ